MLSSMSLVTKDLELKLRGSELKSQDPALKLEDSEKKPHINSTQFNEVVKSPKKIVKNVMKKITSHEDFMKYQWAWMN